MAVINLSDASIKTGGKRTTFWDQEAVANSFFSIASTTVTSGSNVPSVTFSNIPQNYTHLQLRMIGRHTSADTDNNFYIQFNSDTATNYSNHNLSGNGSSVTSGAGTTISTPYIFRVPGASSAANIYGVGIADILDYNNTNKFKTVRSITGHDQNGSGIVMLFSSNWRSTSAITSITIFGASFNILGNSSFALYGVMA